MKNIILIVVSLLYVHTSQSQSRDVKPYSIVDNSDRPDSTRNTIPYVGATILTLATPYPFMIEDTTGKGKPALTIIPLTGKREKWYIVKESTHNTFMVDGAGKQMLIIPTRNVLPPTNTPYYPEVEVRASIYWQRQDAKQ